MVCIQYFLLGQKSILFLQGQTRQKSVYKIKVAQVASAGQNYMVRRDACS